MPYSPPLTATSFARQNSCAARVRLFIFALLVTGFVTLSLSPLRSGFADSAPRGPGDIALYQAEIARLQSGESYYSAVGAELRAFGYPTKSVFNWRTPLPFWWIAHAPLASRASVMLLAMLVVIGGMRVAAKYGGVREMLMVTPLLFGALFPCFCDDLFVMSEVWAGTLLAGSLIAFALDYSLLGVIAAIAGLFIRELVAPYCLLCLALAVKDRRWRELIFWCMGLLAYALFYTWHVTNVLGEMRPDDVAPPSWLACGGAPFLISLAQMNAFLLVTPQWLSAIYLAVLLFGFADWNSKAGSRFSFAAAAYLAVFALVGQPFNQYWGSMLAPLFCFGAARGLASLADTIRIARHRTIRGPAVELTFNSASQIG